MTTKLFISMITKEGVILADHVTGAKYVLASTTSANARIDPIDGLVVDLELRPNKNLEFT